MSTNPKDTNPKETLTLKELQKKSYACTGKVVSDLVYAFQRDFTDEEACLYAGIGHDSYYRWRKESEEFTAMIKKAKSLSFVKSKEIIFQELEKGEVNRAEWFLERRQKDRYSSRTESTGKDGEPLNPPDNLTKILKRIRKIKDVEELQRVATEPFRDSEDGR